MYKQDYKIIIQFDQNGEPYWNVIKKGEPHKCDRDELKMVSSTFSLLRAKIDFATESTQNSEY